jgi:hypothetical protein
MPKYLIERKLPAGRLGLAKIASIPDKPRINWLHTYVTGDKCYCVYDAPSERSLRNHLQQAPLPVSKISRVVSILDPTKLASIIDPTKLE